MPKVHSVGRIADFFLLQCAVIFGADGNANNANLRANDMLERRAELCREVAVGRRTLQYNTTNRLVKSPNWDIGLQKTGYISEAGQCLVMQTKVAGRQLIMVFLDSAGKLSRIADAERVGRWVENQNARTDVAMLKNAG